MSGSRPPAWSPASSSARSTTPTASSSSTASRTNRPFAASRRTTRTSPASRQRDGLSASGHRSSVDGRPIAVSPSDLDHRLMGAGAFGGDDGEEFVDGLLEVVGLVEDDVVELAGGRQFAGGGVETLHQ